MSSVGKLDPLVVRDIGAETVVYDTRTDRAYCMGRIAAAVWREWDGCCSLMELTLRVERSLGEPVDLASVRLASRRLKRAGVILEPMPRTDRSGESQRRHGRRMAVRAVGAAAALAVLSLAVPSPAQSAATCLPNGRPCSRSSECCSHCCNANAGRCAGGGPCDLT